MNCYLKIGAEGKCRLPNAYVLPKSEWFSAPLDDLIEAEICDKSGQLASDICDATTKQIPSEGIKTAMCKYHKLVHLDKTKTYRVNASCEPMEDINSTPQFILPPLMAWYYKKHHVDYTFMPPLRDDCKGLSTPVMAFSEPANSNTIIVPKGISGERNKVVFKIAHIHPTAKLHWYLDDTYLKTTQNFNEIGIDFTLGYHTITVIDNLGNELRKRIRIK